MAETERGQDIEVAIETIRSESGVSTEEWKAFSAVVRENGALEREVSVLRDIARRAAILVRWFSREDFPFTEQCDADTVALNDDAQSLTSALERAGFYAEGWGS